MHAVEPSHEEKIALLPSASDTERMLIYKLNIGEKAKIYVESLLLITIYTCKMISTQKKGEEWVGYE